MLSDNQKEMLEFYNAGLKLYKGRAFAEAREEFKKALGVMPEDGPSKLYLERCETYIETPPPADWDGVYTMTTK